MKSVLWKKIIAWKLVIALFVCTIVACKMAKHSLNTSDTRTTNVEHSTVKLQSIGNCWLYAVAGMLESLHKDATDEEVNLSESYWTWWHFYNQILNAKNIREIDAGGEWEDIKSLILQHGLMLEKNYIQAESSGIVSIAQKKGLNYVADRLGWWQSLSSQVKRTPTNIRRELDRGFGDSMARAEKLSIPANQFIVGHKPDGGNVTAADLFSDRSSYAWTTLTYPQLKNIGELPDFATQEKRNQVMRLVMRALNDGVPVLMTFYVDFNSIDVDTGRFSSERRQKKGPGKGGLHMVALEDYTAMSTLGEISWGNRSSEQKHAAMNGFLTAIKVKNSWGIGHPVSGVDGYAIVERSYLDVSFDKNFWGALPLPKPQTNPLRDFILPAKYVRGSKTADEN